jgi:DNA-binding response OmpR family regulator
MGSSTHSDKPLILVVDDDGALRQGLSMLLSRDGYAVSSARDGAEAVKLMQGGLLPDLVLLDVMMPEMDGWEVLAWIRSHPPHSETLVMMLTAKHTQDAKIKGFEGGADDYLTKPFSLSELRCRVKALLRRGGAAVPAGCPEIVVMSPGGGRLILRAGDIHYFEGIRNYTYLHTYDRKHLCNLSLHKIEEMELPGFMRLHRSYIVNLDKVRWFGWITRSAFRVRLGDAEGTELPVSRNLVSQVRERLGGG